MAWQGKVDAHLFTPAHTPERWPLLRKLLSFLVSADSMDWIDRYKADWDAQMTRFNTTQARAARFATSSKVVIGAGDVGVCNEAGVCRESSLGPKLTGKAKPGWGEPRTRCQLGTPQSAHTSAPLLSVPAVMEHCDLVLPGAECAVDAARVFDGAIVCVEAAELGAFAATALQQVDRVRRFILVVYQPTSVGSASAGELAGHMLAVTADERVYATYAAVRRADLAPHPKIVPVPLGVHDGDAAYVRKLWRTVRESRHTPKPHLLYVDGSPLPGVTIGSGWAVAADATADRAARLEILAAARYVVCTDEQTAWEAMLVETVPVLLSADRATAAYLSDLPVLWVESYADVSSERLEAEYQALRHRQYKLHLLYAKSASLPADPTPHLGPRG